MNGYSGDTDRRDRPRSMTETPLTLFGAVVVFLLIVVAAAVAMFALRSEPESERASEQVAVASIPTLTPELSPTPVITPTLVITPSTTPSAIHAAAQEPTSLPAPESTGEPTPNVSGSNDGDESVSASVPGTVEQQQTTNESEQPEQEPVRDQPLLELLPGLDDVPEGFAIVNEGPLTIEQAADLHPDPAAQLQRLREWGFRDAARREMQPSSGDGPVTNLVVAVVDFGSPEQARLALDAGHAEVKAVAAGTNAAEAQVTDAIIQRIADHSVAAEGVVTIENQEIAVAYVFVQDGSLAYTIVGLAPVTSTSPLRVVTDVALTLGT